MADPAQVNAILATIRKTESNNNYTARNGKSSASGAYQFINSTWKGLGGSTRTAAEASPQEQDDVARRYVESILDANGGDPRAVFKTWYVGNPNAAENYIPSPEAGNKMTVGAYADLQMRRLQETQATADPYLGTDLAYMSVAPNAENRPSSGGSGGGSGGGGGGGTYTNPTPQTPQDPKEFAAQSYGYLAAYLDHPEVGPIILQAAREGWSEQRLEGALHGTTWWNATNTSAKQWESLVNQTPTEAESQIGERTEELRRRAQQNGFSLSDAALRTVAENSLRYGWNTAQWDKALGEEAVKRPGDLQRLRMSTLGGRLDQVVTAYGIPISAASRDQWLADIASGRKTEDEFVNEAKGIAKSLYPSLNEAIDAGATVQQAFDPYRQLAADTLGITPEQVKLSDPKWSSALSQVNDKGMKVPMSLDQWQAQLKSNTAYGYQFTSTARDEAYQLAAGMAEKFGGRR